MSQSTNRNTSAQPILLLLIIDLHISSVERCAYRDFYIHMTYVLSYTAYPKVSLSTISLQVNSVNSYSF